MTRLQELSDKVDRADLAYYTTGKFIVEDALYDKWMTELITLDPTNVRITKVGDSIRETILQKAKHRIMMGSQFKATNEAEYQAWVTNVGVATVFHGSYKMDGGSCSFEYQDGRMVSSISRGDGIEGEDITANAINFKGLPPVCKLPGGTPFNGFIRGEIVLLDEDWTTVDPERLTNPRNTAVGIARRKSGEESELLSVYAFRIFGSNGESLYPTEEGASKAMEKMGFTVAPYRVGTQSEMWAYYLETQKVRPTLKYWIDGVIVKVNDLNDQMAFGESDNRPKGQVAIKFEAEGAETTILSVDLQVGHTGAITPVANVTPVQIGGTTIDHPTLCNFTNIATLGLAVGDKVMMVKAGDIIPRVIEVVEKGANRVEIPIPTICPVCGGEVGYRSNVDGENSTVLYCLNAGCSAKVFGKIEKFVKSVNILGLGESLIHALIKNLGVTDAADLYTLVDKKIALASIKMNGKTKLGMARAENVLAQIDKARQLTLSQFLGALGIFGLGRRRVVLVQAAQPQDLNQLDDWLGAGTGPALKLAGLPNTGDRIAADLMAMKSLIDKFLNNGLKIMKAEPKELVRAGEALNGGGMIICITGKLSAPKEVFYDLIRKAGHLGTDEYYKGVTHLVAADPTGGSSKLQKARKAGVPILDESGLLELLGK